MKPEPLIVLLLFHIVIALLSTCYILLRKTHLKKQHIIPVLLLPLVGPLGILIIELMYLTGEAGQKEPDMESIGPSEDILWKALKSYHESGNIVPLEEAILIDDVRTRRKFMLQTLYESPLKYLDILMLAKNNEDVETSHYATTTISNAQRNFQIAIQDLAVAAENHPEDPVLLDRYIETLGKYIDSGLLEEHLLRNLRMVYRDVLDKKLAKARSDKLALIRKLRNSIELQEYAAAFETSETLRLYWPEDEQTWIEALRVCVEGRDQDRLHAAIDELQTTNIAWTKEGKEQVSAWVNGRQP